MNTEEALRGRGTPYSLSEAKQAVKQHAMDQYHLEMMQWLIAEVERLQAQISMGAMTETAKPSPPRVREMARDAEVTK